jgi:probable phosphoglycerate mutase
MTEIILIRHGETDWNVEKRLQGHLDIDLNAEGERQAAALARALRDEQFDLIASSDLQRAVRTARAVAASRDLEVLQETGLRERSYGAFEGLRYTDIEQRYPDAYAAWRARDIDARYPAGQYGAETLREFSARAVGAVLALAHRNRNRKIAIVTHGGVLECVYRAAAGIGLERPRDFEIRNAAINRIIYNDAKLEIVNWCDVAHLSHIALDEVDK